MAEPDASPELNTAFRVSAGGGAGLTADQVRSARLVSPTRGTRCRADADDPELARASGVLLACRSHAVLCDVSAARHWGLPLPPWIVFDDRARLMSVAAPRGENRAQRANVRGRRLTLPADQLTCHSGLNLTNPARTWLDCAEQMPIAYLVAMGDAALRRRLVSTDELSAMVAWARRRRGVLNARRALPVLDPRAESPGESLARAHLVLAALPRPHCNLDIFDDGQWLARADMAWPDARLIVEYDGAWHLDEKRRRSDAARRNLLQAAGWRVIVLTADDLKRPWLMVNAVRAALTMPWPSS